MCSDNGVPPDVAPAARYAVRTLRVDAITAGGTVIERNVYDGFDHIIENRKKTGTATSTTKYTYDPLDRTTTKTADAGGTNEKTTTYNYLGLSSEVLDEEVAGKLTKSYQYSPWGQRLSQVTHNNDGTEENVYYGYNPLSDLRAAIRAATTIPLIEHIDDRYRLDPGHVDVDLWRLHAAAHHAATTLTDPAAAWQAVIDAYTGDLAAGHAWPWIDPPREAARRLVLDAYSNAAAAQPDPHHRLRLLQDAIRVDPYNQTLHQLAADQLSALGDSDAATRLLHGHQQRLHLAGITDAQPAPTSR